MADPQEIKRIGRYEIERVLGEGAMGVVYEGKDTRLHRKVAIKTILKSALDSGSAKEYSMRFAREAQAVARLNHPNIVQVFDYAEEGDVAYIVMELVKGKELKNFFDAKERFDVKEAVHIMAELCDALHFAHEAGIIHRDIKPANVMIDSQGRVKLTDFGVARITDPDRTLSDRTQAGAVIGTPAYMSPEQIQSGMLDRRTDVFSAGVILYEFLSGTKPFTGSGAWAIAKKIIGEEPPPPSSINAAISPLFDAVVARALAKKVEARYQTARQLGFALARALEGEAETDDVERTIVLKHGFGAAASADAPAPQAGAATELHTIAMVPAARTKATELEFWRSIKDGNDSADFDSYIEQFPNGIYVALAKRRSGKLRGLSSGGQDQERREIEEAAQREAEARTRLAEEKAAMEAGLARREAEFQQREAELLKREAEGPKKASLVPFAIAAAIAAMIGGAWFAFKPPDPMAERVAELTRLLDDSKKRESELVQSRQREAELLKELQLARQREADALKSGDVVKQRELAAQTRQREAEAAKQAETTRQREAEAKKQAEAADLRRAEIARLKGESGRKTEPVKVAEPVRPAEPVKLAAVAPAPAPAPAPTPAPMNVPDTAPVSIETMLQRAISLERDGKTAEAARLLRQVTREGKGEAAGQAAKRYGDMLQKGVPGVPRDYGEALRYYEIARLNGVDVPVTRAR
ncbi:MAG: protein kinase [Betaproteobacteria bacterium]